MRFRRKQIPEHLRDAHAAFDAQVQRLEDARDALMSCLPVGRVDPVPVPVGLELLADTLAEIEAELPAWRVEALEAEWQACREAVAEARGNMATAHEVARTSTELEELLAAVEDVDEPLGHAFSRAEHAFMRLRV